MFLNAASSAESITRSNARYAEGDDHCQKGFIICFLQEALGV